MLKKEFQYYLDKQDELVKDYNGRYVVIKNNTFLGDYATALEAIKETSKVHELGSFLVQKCTPGPDDYTATYHSRAYV